MATTYRANFTFVNGVRDHEFELHATGCRDLRHLPGSALRWSVDASAEKPGDLSSTALNEFLVEAPGAKVYTQACCNPRRMAAIGRLLTVGAPVTEPTPGLVEVDGLSVVPSDEVPAAEPVAEVAKPSAKERRAAKRAAKKQAAA